MARDDCVWSADEIAAASRAANAPRSEERIWRGQPIMWWSEWVAHHRREAVMILENGTRYVIREREQDAQEESAPYSGHRRRHRVE